MPKRSSKGRLDLSQLAKSIVDQATGEEPAQPEQPEKNPAAVAPKGKAYMSISPEKVTHVGLGGAACPRSSMDRAQVS